MEHANKIYNAVVQKTLKSGTTTCSYYATIHKDASLLLAKICSDLGQRALIGKVSMDQNSPPYYIESTESSKRDNELFVDEISGLNKDLINCCITPRFAPSCTSELLGHLGDLATSKDLCIQTHISENRKEIVWVKELFKAESYAQVYDDHKLLNSKTILAHAIHLTTSELELIKLKNCGISHCPISNFMLTSGILDVERLMNMNIDKVGLGSDCAGGYDVCIMEQMRQSILASKVLKIISNGNDNVDKMMGINYKQAFYMATLGGAKVLNMDTEIGNFQIGKKFDALIMNFRDILIQDCDQAQRLEKFIMLGNPTNIEKVYVNGINRF